MSKFIVVVLPDERKAYEALHAIRELDQDGTVTFYAGTVVERKADGTLDVKQAVDDGPLGLGIGSLVGGLVGLFGGPVGAAVGMVTGGFLGTFRDVIHAGVSEEFVEKITHELRPGNFAVVAEVSEEWLTPIDAKMEALGGKVVREYRDDFVDARIEKNVDEVRNELAQRKMERAGAKAKKMEAKLDERIEDARNDLQQVASKARARLDEKKQEMLAKIGALKDQSNKAKPEVRARIETRITEIHAELAAREEKLSHAFGLAEQALSP
jgi:uncharacterized membrane protein